MLPTVEGGRLGACMEEEGMAEVPVATENLVAGGSLNNSAQFECRLFC